MATNGLKYGDELAAAPKDWSNLARSTDHVSEKAIHADSVDPKLAQEFTDDQFPGSRTSIGRDIPATPRTAVTMWMP